MNQVEQLFSAIKAGEVSQVSALLKAEPALAKAVDREGVSAVMLAVYYGRPEIVDELLARGLDLNLWEASAIGHKERVVDILDRYPALVNAFSSDGHTPLGLAVFFGHLEVMESLLARGAAVNMASRNAMKVCPLHSAVAYRNPDVALAMAKRLLEQGAAPNVAQQGDWTPLHQAAAHGHTEMAKLLVYYGADKTARSDEGKTPLDMARAGDHAEVVRLLEQG